MADAPAFAFAPEGTYAKHVALVSYPRSGNTLARRLIEEVTGEFTGSDTRPDRHLSQQLRECGLEGEGIVDSRVWVIKTHFPERRGYRPFKANKAIVVVRNPFDAMDSYFNMVLTRTHTDSLEESEYERFADAWREFVERETDVWVRFHQYWLAPPVPTLIVRYEALMTRRREALEAMFTFMLDLTPDQLREHALAPSIARVAAGSGGMVYKPRSGLVNGSLRHFGAEQQVAVARATLPLLHELGYQDVVATVDAAVAALCGEEPAAAATDAREAAAPAHADAGSCGAPTAPCDGATRASPHPAEVVTLRRKGTRVQATVNLGTCLRPCTDEDPWGRGMRWREQLEICDSNPVRIKAKAGRG